MTPKLTAARSLALTALLAAVVGGGAAAAEKKAGPGASAKREAGGGVIQIFKSKDAADKAATEKAKSQPAPRPSALSTLARTGFWLGLVVVLLCGVMLLAKRFLPKSMGMFRSAAMEMVGRSYLGPKRCVYLVKVGGRMLVVGSAENGLSCLSEITAPDEVEHLAALARSDGGGARSAGRGFAAALGQRISGLAGMVRRGGEQVEAGDQDLDFEEPEREYEFAGPARGAGGLDELREKVEGLKARLKTIS